VRLFAHNSYSRKVDVFTTTCTHATRPLGSHIVFHARLEGLLQPPRIGAWTGLHVTHKFTYCMPNANSRLGGQELDYLIL